MAIRRRSGFAIMLVIVTVAIVATVAGVAAPFLRDDGDRDRVKRTSEALHLLADGVEAFRTTVKAGPTKQTTPHFLSQLSAQAVVSGDSGGCDAFTYNNAAAIAWDATAPFTELYVPVGGLWTPLGRISDVPSNTDTAAGVFRTSNRDEYFIQIPNVDYALAQMLDLYVDGTINGTADTVRYLAPDANGLTLLSYRATPTLPAC